MKKKMFLFGYLGLLMGAAALQSCNGGPINPYDGGAGGDIDTTMIDDSTYCPGCDSNSWSPDDSTDSTDSTYCPGGDSTTWSPDPTGFGG